jgi:hypothetical protein
MKNVRIKPHGINVAIPEEGGNPSTGFFLRKLQRTATAQGLSLLADRGLDFPLRKWIYAFATNPS